MVGTAPVVEGFGELWVEPDGLIVVLYRAVVLAPARVGDAPGIEGFGAIFLRCLAHLYHRRATAGREAGIGGETTLLIEVLGGRHAAEAAHQHQGQCTPATHWWRFL